MHSFDVLHRDLSLDNVLVDENMVAKVCDFGVAQVKDEHTRRHAHVRAFGA